MDYKLLLQELQRYNFGVSDMSVKEEPCVDGEYVKYEDIKFLLGVIDELESRKSDFEYPPLDNKEIHCENCDEKILDINVLGDKVDICKVECHECGEMNGICLSQGNDFLWQEIEDGDQPEPPERPDVELFNESEKPKENDKHD